MKKVIISVCAIFLMLNCTSAEDESSDVAKDADFSLESGIDSGSGDGDGDGGNGENDKEPGQITAAEWNDLNHWGFWVNLLNSQDYTEYQENWNFNTRNRIAVHILDKNTGEPVNNVAVSLFKGNDLLSEVKTDNFGKANVFIDVFESEKASANITMSDYTIEVNGEPMSGVVSLFEHGVNTYSIQKTATPNNKIELAFIVDATGSMSDELEFLKSDLTNVISRVQNENQDATILTSTVFYRDFGDDYVTKRSDFSPNISSTVNFIKNQFAAGGGDFEEAVDVAINEAVNEQQWSTNAKTKIAFLILDAPPHLTNPITLSINKTIQTAAKNGIKIIPITASGINKSTEFLMRYFATVTNGTYVFITNDSGIGNNHLEPTVGEYQVEFLNDLMVRLINKYAE